MGLVASLAGPAVLGSIGLFSYNRENYFFDKELQQKREFQSQEMAIRQFELYREDVRDLVQLTVRKMDNYLLVNTLQLGFCVTLFTDGRPRRENRPTDSPPWLIGLYAMCNAGAFLYYLLSMWLAMHASIAAHSFGVRLLTQCVRLPVPSAAQLDQVTARAEDYEGLTARDFFRIPLLRKQFQALNQAMTHLTSDEAGGRADPDAESASVEGLERPPSEGAAAIPVAMLQHVRLYRQLQSNWQSYDAYARVCMALGTNQILHALTYEVLILLMAENNEPWPSLFCVAIFTTCAWILAKLDLYLSRRILICCFVLLILPPTLATTSLVLLHQMPQRLPVFVRQISHMLILVAYALHVVWIIFTTRVARAQNFDSVKLPTKFRSVLYLDVFGWLSEDVAAQPEGVSAAAGNSGYGRTLSVIAEDLADASIGPPVCELPGDMRPVLEEDAWRLQSRLSRDLARWGSMDESVSAATREELRKLSMHFQRAANKFKDLLRSRTFPEEVGGGDEEGIEVWLRCEYNPHGQTHEYYYCCKTSDTRWEMPQGMVRICDLRSMRDDMATFCDKLGALEQSRGKGHAGALLPNGASTAGSLRSDADVAPAARGAATLVAPATQDAGSTFHPAPARSSSADLGRQNLRATPGRLPWDTVKRGSYALVAGWLAGFLWVFLVLELDLSVPFDEDHPRAEPEVVHLAAPAVLAARGDTGFMQVGSWPAFVQPRGLACHDAMGTVALVSGTYTVHVVDFSGNGKDAVTTLRAQAAAVQAAIDACLQWSPDFQSQGLADLSLECPAAHGNYSGWPELCSVIILGAQGRHALRCGVSQASPSTGRPPLAGRFGPARPLGKLVLHGGPWRAIAAVSDSDGSLWALGRDGRAVVRLRPRPGVPSEFVPHLELPRPEGEDAGLSGLHVLPGRALLGKMSSGLLRAWPLSGGSPQLWSAPGAGVGGLAGSTAEDGGCSEKGLLCSTQGNLYLLRGGTGLRGAASAFEFWQSQMPHAQ